MILVDTGPVVALQDVRDPYRGTVVAALTSITDRLVIPLPILGEVGHFLETRTSPTVESLFLRDLSTGRFEVASPSSADYGRAADLVEQYAGFPLGTVDALVAAMAERLNVTTLFTLDHRHFGAIRPAHCDAFTLVP